MISREKSCGTLGHRNRYKIWFYGFLNFYNLDMDYLGCTSVQFTCANGQCVPVSARCNNVRECTDGSDEQNCGMILILINPIRYLSRNNL